ncbi:hypothetical protein M077_4208 [Bacteroides fragilis str. 2-F-2 |nr:hypothetical protein M077_4220 [Bacteroides fragilis str. 2-F-2 \
MFSEKQNILLLFRKQSSRRLILLKNHLLFGNFVNSVNKHIPKK